MSQYILNSLIIFTRLNSYKYLFLVFTFLVAGCDAFSVSQAAPTTLPPTQRENIITDLYINNGGCKLPCLLGITPGETSIQDVYNKFSQIGYFEDQTRVVDTYQNIAFSTISPPDGYINKYNDNKWGFSMNIKDNVVIGFVTGASDVFLFSDTTLSKFLSVFDQPEEIWVEIIQAQIGDPDYSIVLYYPSQGVFINWRGRVNSVISETDSNITVTVCPQLLPTEADTIIGSYPPFFYLFSPNKKMSFEEIIVQHLTHDPSFRLLDKLSTKNFYDTYINPDTNVCFPLSFP